MNKIGTIEVICGPMFSGKTGELINRSLLEIKKNKNVSLFKPTIDNRYSSKHIVSHDNKKIECYCVDSAKEILKYQKNTEIFSIDEAQFFNNNIVDVCKNLTKLGKRVIIAGLDKDYKAKPFKQISKLLLIADNVTKLNAICVKCGKIASFSQRISSHKSQILVGETEKYEARCENCHQP